MVIDCDISELYYGTFKAVRDTQIPIAKGTITAFIGPSGCGKSTVLRCLNRMNDLVRGFRFKGHVHFRGNDIYHPSVDPVAVRRHIGMVFQQPNPFAMSIYRNVTFGLRLNGFRGDKNEKVEQALRSAALWDEVKDKLHKSGAGPFRRPAAAAVHRAGHRHRTGGAADGRTLLRARPDRDAQDRRTDERIEEAVHDRDRHAQSCSRPSAWPTRPGFSTSTRPKAAAPAIWSNSATPNRSSTPREKHTQEYIRGEFS